MNEAINLISSCDTLIVGGTYLVVYPAASFLRYFRGKNLILINKSETQYDDKANIVIHDSIGKVLDECINSL
jgi:NAD-dependent deacetylase